MTENFEVVSGIRVYDMQYLMSGELTDEDVNYLTHNKSYVYSLVVGMYRFVKSNKSTEYIINAIKTDNSWLKDHAWSSFYRNKFEKNTAKFYKNLYYYGKEQSKMLAQWFSIMYGFSTYESNRLTKPMYFHKKKKKH